MITIKSHLTLVAAVCIIPFVQANDIEPGKEFYTAVPATNPIVLDGDLSEWNGATLLENPNFSIPKGSGDDGMLVSHETWSEGTWDGLNDHSMSVQMIYNEENVYLGIIVTDDYHENAANSAWNGDSVQIHVANGDRDTQVGLYSYALGGVEGALGDLVVFEEGPGGTEAAIARVGETTTYEICLPKAALELDELRSRVQFGIGILINDGDEASPGQHGWSGWGINALLFGKTPQETALITLGGTDADGDDTPARELADPFTGLVSVYAFDSDLSDSLGNNPALTEFNNARSSFSEGAWSWEARSNPGGGLILDVNPSMASVYSIGLRMKLDQFYIGENDPFVKLIDFKDGAVDLGLYFFGDSLRFYPETEARGTASSNTYFDLMFTSNASGQVSIYLDGKSVHSFVDARKVAVLESMTDDRARFRLFHDDTAHPPSDAWSSGTVDEIRLWDRGLRPSEISSAFNQLEHFAISEISLLSDSGVELTWNSIHGKTYAIETSHDLIAWDVHVTALPSTGIESSYTHRLADFSLKTQQYYRVREQPLFAESFEEGAEGWTTGIIDGLNATGTTWEVGAPEDSGPASAFAGKNAYGTDLDADYEDDTGIYLRTPVIDLTGVGSKRLTFHHFLAVSDREGGRLNILAPDGIRIVDSLKLYVGPDGNTADWTQESIRLPDLNRSVIIEFEFLSETNGAPRNRAGWFIDEVIVD